MSMGKNKNHTNRLSKYFNHIKKNELLYINMSSLESKLHKLTKLLIEVGQN